MPEITPLELVNTTLINYASCKVLPDVDGVLAASGISESLYETFRTYYHHVLKANSQSIKPEPPFVNEFAYVDRDTIREKALELIKYFIEVQRIATTETLNLMGAAADTRVKSTCEALSEAYSKLSQMIIARPDPLDQSSIEEVVEEVSNKYKLPNLYSEFQVIIMYFDTFPFNYKKFESVYVVKINDPAIPSIEVQRRYLTSLLKKDSQYNTQRNYINRICNHYEQLMKKVEGEIDSENERVRKLYQGTTSELVNFTNSLIDELSI
jgi:hypothetical protein